jgi:hypothetical protein
MPKKASATVDRVENLRIWVERCDDQGRIFMSIREDRHIPEGGLYVCCHHEGTKFFFAGDAIDFLSLNVAIAENVRDEFEVVVTGSMEKVLPDVFESMTDEHLADVTGEDGNEIELSWSDQDLLQMNQDSAPIHFIHAESLTVNL